ncbi:response regulator [Aeromicrobium sp.]|nr:response regulator [Candidatus Saccharibacteria bacterium]
MAKVLLVEDDNNLREIYEARLQAEGYDTATASDGEQALVVAKETRPDLVISDVMMPKISGFEMLDILRNTDGLKDVKVIMLTALGQAEDKTRADELGADKYLVKSQVTLEDIVKTAHQLLDDVAPPAVQAPMPVAPLEPVVAASAQPVAAPAPLPGPIAVPVAELPFAAVTSPESAQELAEQAVSRAATVTTNDVNTMQAQIDSLVAQAPLSAPELNPPTVPTVAPAPEVALPAPVVTAPIVAPAPAVPVQPVAVQPQPMPQPNADVAPQSGLDTASAHDDQVMATAVDSLTAATEAQRPSDVTAVEVAPPAPDTSTRQPTASSAILTTAATQDDGASSGHKKIIQPINDPANARPDINALLAAEEATEAEPELVLEPGALPEPPTTVSVPMPEPVVAAVATEQVADPALQLSPELQAAVTEADQPIVPAPAAAPGLAPPANPITVVEPPVDPTKPNPNDISL